MSQPLLQDIKVYYENDSRKIQCFCGKICNRALVPHLKREHPDVWEKWTIDFVHQLAEGKSPNQIMKRYRLPDGKLLFSWTVVERAIRKLVETNKVKPIFARKKNIDKWEPENFVLENTTVWDFKDRGNWAVHQNDYRGNWSPKLVRNLLLRYTKPGDWVIDPFVGGGTTLIEAWLMDRKSIGIDISPFAIEMTKQRVSQLKEKNLESCIKKLDKNIAPVIELGDSKELEKILQEKNIPNLFSFAAVHPPYFDAFQYSETIDGDLSRIHCMDKFCQDLNLIATKIWQCLKDDGKCGVLIGDVRKNKCVVPVGFKVLNIFSEAGFSLKEIIIKVQHNDKSTEFWFNKIDFLIAHEYLYVFEKIKKDNQTGEPIVKTTSTT
ncbi:MAG: DNA methyltransferase [Candidatus Bathyarchaeota archaeon]|nr:DNA methyltransferase [Candidatus Bathyarchaeota archaeon]